MRPFYLLRIEDETGVSGTGIVAEGVEWADGSCALRWRTETASTGIYGSLADVQAIHGHQGKTRIVIDHGFSTQDGIERIIEEYGKTLADARKH